MNTLLTVSILYLTFVHVISMVHVTKDAVGSDEDKEKRVLT